MDLTRTAAAHGRHALAAELAARVNRRPEPEPAQPSRRFRIDLPVGHASRLPDGPPLGLRAYGYTPTSWPPRPGEDEVERVNAERAEALARVQSPSLYAHEHEPEPPRRPVKVEVTLPDQLAKRPADVPLVPRSRGIALARRLRAEGVTSAKWARQPHGDRWELSVDEDQEAKAAELLDQLAREQRGGDRR